MPNDQTSAAPHPEITVGPRLLAWVGGAGCLGGVGAALWAAYFQVQPDIHPALFWLASIFLGGLAALFGVFLLAQTDRSRFIHCFVLAAACGFAWAPVLESAQAFVSQQTERAVERESEQELDETEHLLNALRSGDAGQPPAKLIERATEQATALNRQAGAVDSRQLQQRLQEGSQQLVEAIAQTDAPVAERSKAIGTITRSSLQHRNLNTASAGLTSLRHLAETSDSRQDRVSSIQTIGAIAETPDLQTLPSDQQRLLLGAAESHLKALAEADQPDRATAEATQDSRKRLDQAERVLRTQEKKRLIELRQPVELRTLESER